MFINKFKVIVFGKMIRQTIIEQKANYKDVKKLNLLIKQWPKN